MSRRLLVFCTAALLVAFALSPASALAASRSLSSAATSAVHSAATDALAVDPDYVYAQLDYLATHFLRREAGFDNGLAPDVNGHDEFAAYWEQEVGRDLGGYASAPSRVSFTTTGWQNRAAVVP